MKLLEPTCMVIAPDDLIHEFLSGKSYPYGIRYDFNTPSESLIVYTGIDDKGNTHLHGPYQVNGRNNVNVKN